MVYERLARLGDQITVEDRPVLGPARSPFPEARRPGFATELRRALRSLAWPLVLGVAARLALMPFTSWVKDDAVWWQAAVGGLQHLGLYQRAGFSYPPLWGDLLQGLGWVLQHLGLAPSNLGTADLRLEPATTADQFSTIVTTPVFNVCFKTILLVFDLATGLLLYEVCRQSTGSEDRSRLAFCLWFLNPFVLFSTGVFGAFDVLVAFGVLASLLLLLSGRYAWSGVALGMAIMVKGSPIFLLPFFALLVADRGGDVPGRAGASARQRRGALVALFAGTTGTVVVVLLPLVATHQLAAALDSVFARTSGAQAGGFSVFGLLEVRGLGGVFDAVNAWTGLGTTILVLQVVLAVALGVLGVRRARRNLASAAFGTVALVLMAVVVLGPLAAPQYALWFLPELVAMVAIWRRGLWSLVIFSVAPLVFLVILYGPAAMVFPFIEQGWVSATAVARSVNAWNANVVLPWSAGAGAVNALAPLAVAAIVGVVVTARVVLRGPPPRRRLVEVMGRAAGGIVPLLVAALAAALAGAGVVAAAPRGAAISLTTQASAQATTVTATVQPGASLEGLRLIAFPATTTTLPRNVDVYFDPAYPVENSSLGSVAASASDVASELRLRGFRGTVRTVDTAALARVLADTRGAPTTAVVDMAGILPAPVFSASVDLLTPWLRHGGTLYWGGPAPGYLTGRPGEASDHTPYPGSLGIDGVARFFQPGLLDGSAGGTAVGTTPATDAKDLGLQYAYDGSAPLSRGVAGLTSLGWDGGGRSSITLVNEGFGRLVLFGGPVVDTKLASSDVALLVLSGVLARAGPLSSVEVPTSVVRSGGVVRWRAPPPGAHPVVALALDPTVGGIAFARSSASP